MIMMMKAELMSEHRTKMQRAKTYSGKAMFVLCVASFLVGSLFSTRTNWTSSPTFTHSDFPSNNRDCDHKRKLVEGSSYDHSQSGNHVMKEVAKTHQAIKTLDKTMSTLEMELAAVRKVTARSQNNTTKPSNNNVLNKEEIESEKEKAKKKGKPIFAVIGINTAFSSKKRREVVRETWMAKHRQSESGTVVMRFVIGRTGNTGGAMDKALDAEAAEHSDFLRLANHVEGYHRLSSKTRAYFSAAVSLWPEASFFVKVDDDVHVNPAALVSTLAAHRFKPRVYIGCMKSGPVLYDEGVKYYEPEFLRFGDKGNSYFRHATGQIYAISNDLASYISANGHILRRYANEDVSLGSWLLGLDVELVDDRFLCCGTPPDCEWKAQEGNICVASFDWHCSGVCKPEERMKTVHASCGEGIGALSSLGRFL